MLRFSFVFVFKSFEVALSVGFVVSLGLAYYFTMAGVDLGFITGFMEGSLLTTTVLSYVFLLAEVVLFSRTGGEPGKTLKGYTSLEAGQALLPNERLSISIPIALVLSILVQIGVAVLVWWEMIAGQNLVLATAAGIAGIGFVFSKLFARMLQPLRLCPCISCFTLVIVLGFVLGVVTTRLGAFILASLLFLE